MRNNLINSKGLMLIALCFFLNVVQVYAQQISLPFGELDTRVKLPREEFQNNSEVYDREVAGDQLLNHSFRLPTGWSDITGQTSKTDFSTKVETVLAKFVGPPNMYARSDFVVKVLKIDREISLLHWYYSYLGSRGFSVLAMKEMDNGKRIEAEAIMLRPEANFVVRTVALLSGDRVVLAEYSVPDPFWNDARDEALWSIASFYLKYTDDRTIEPRKEFSILDIIKFVYPSSWQVTTPRITVVDELSSRALTYNRRGDLDGRIDSYFVASHVEGTRQERLERFKELYSGVVKFQLGELKETIENISFPDTIKAGRVDVFEADLPGGRATTGYEIWLAILESEVYDGYVFMNTIGRDVDFLTWSKNQTSFKIMVESMNLYGQAR